MKKVFIILGLILVAVFFYPKEYSSIMPYPGPNGEIPDAYKGKCFGFSYDSRCLGVVFSSSR
jgi:hypothetical protein